MLIIGCDFHTRYQQIAMAEEGTGGLLCERRLDHEGGEAEGGWPRLNSEKRLWVPHPCGFQGTVFDS